MKKILVALLLTICLGQVKLAYAASNCFIAKENDYVHSLTGDCQTRYAPESTFKIVLSLIGFATGILQDPHNPRLTRPETADYYLNICKDAHDPHSWLRDSCVWYSQILVKKLGVEKIAEYLKKFKYGNMDIRGLKGADPQVSPPWIMSSLKISAEEQIAFLQKLTKQELSLPAASYQQTKQIMFAQELPGGWRLYGKTGNGRLTDSHGDQTPLQHGWFVGYIEKDKRIITFAQHIVDKAPEATFASLRARNAAFLELWYLINKLAQ